MAGNQGHNFRKATDAFQKVGDTIVGNDDWLGAEAMIMPGVGIGNGAVIAAKALVTKEIPAY